MSTQSSAITETTRVERSTLRNWIEEEEKDWMEEWKHETSKTQTSMRRDSAIQCVTSVGKLCPKYLSCKALKFTPRRGKRLQRREWYFRKASPSLTNQYTARKICFIYPVWVAVAVATDAWIFGWEGEISKSFFEQDVRCQCVLAWLEGQSAFQRSKTECFWATWSPYFLHTSQ